MAYPVPDEIAGLAGPPPGAPPSINIGGGGPAPAGALPPDLGGGGPPPELLAALGGGGPGGPPPEEAEESPTDILARIRDDLQKYIQVETDDIDLQMGTKLLDQVQSLFAKNQKEQEAASGTTPAMRGMAKALSA